MSIRVCIVGVMGDEYQRPSEALERVLDIEEEPHLILDPDGCWAVVLSYKALAFTIADISRPLVETGGLCFDPKLRTPHKAHFANEIRIRRLFTGEGPAEKGDKPSEKAQEATPVGIEDQPEDAIIQGLPENAVGFRYFRWGGGQDNLRLSFTAKVPDGDGFTLRLFVVNFPKPGDELSPTFLAKPLLASRTLNAITLTPQRFIGDGSCLMVMCVPENQGPPPPEETVPRGPNVKENLSTNKAPARTYQRLISSKRDEELFEYYTTSEVVLLQFGANEEVYETVLRPSRGGAMIRSISLSPNKRQFLVSLTAKPFSWTLPYSKFPKSVQLWTLEKPLSTYPAPSTHEAAMGSHPAYPERAKVQQVSFEEEDKEYSPVEFTHKAVIDNNYKIKQGGWADPDVNDMDLAEIEDRLTYHGKVFIVNGKPINPVGRTGMVGRGLLGKWGPNHAADAIVTRFSPDDPNMLQMVAIQRRDTGHWAIPGGMVDPGETVPAAMKREFMEEAGNLDMSPEEAEAHRAKVDGLFEHGTEIYRGYVDDPRNTDNAWMESSFVHFHCSEDLGKNIPLAAGDDAQSVRWLDIDESNESFAKLYASHKSMVLRAEELLRKNEAPRPDEIKIAKVHTVVDLPDEEGMVISFDARAPGPRGLGWHWQRPATLVFSYALDGGNPKNEASQRDAICELSAPFRLADFYENPLESPDVRVITKLEFRTAGLSWSKSSAGLVFVSESWRKTRSVRKWILREKADGSYEDKTLMFERSSDDAYASTGSMQVDSDSFGVAFLQQSLKKNEAGEIAFEVLGAGASPVGSRPFYDRLWINPKGDLSQTRIEHIWRSALGPDADENLVDLSREPGNKLPEKRQAVYEAPEEVFPGGEWMMLRRESNDEPPDFYWRHLPSGKEWRLTQHEHPQPSLIGVQKELVKYKRDDGIDLTANLYLPPNYNPERDGPRPCLLWAYPREFKSTKTAGQVKTSPYLFTRTSWSRPVTWVVKDWVVLGFSSPIVAEDPNVEPNDTFIEQLRANAQAAVRLLLDRKIGKPGGFAVGGHSYGGFMTAHLLAHTDLFSAGIARSGAYNRALTPFGFQAEERTYWEAPDTYAKLSPFSHAPKIAKGPGKLLLIHGIKDENPGTFPIQSERLYDALKGHGAITKLVLLPYEGHGYTAKESILHTVYEQEAWLDKYVLPALDDNAEIPAGVCASILAQDAAAASMEHAQFRSRTLTGFAAATLLFVVALRAFSAKL